MQQVLGYVVVVLLGLAYVQNFVRDDSNDNSYCDCYLWSLIPATICGCVFLFLLISFH